ncbi:vacuolar iron transporter homolog 4-like [Coffea arabica]|uniref:Vacuolar iron transporter n=1 Tax=Coffea arabica TaxID=13443 RepID=A0A6P6VID7_COFAR|nr:vacuolar iron transporter homolog 4-like [Coffea arabica]
MNPSSFEIQQSATPSQTPQNESNINDLEAQVASTPDLDLVPVVDYSKRAQWLRAAVLGANDGLLSTASLMMGVGAVRPDVRTMILTGIAGLVAGACSMALGEFVSVYSQCDIELAQMKREKIANAIDRNEYDAKKEDLPSPLQAAAASAFAFAMGAVVPLLAAAFVKGHQLRLGLVVAASSLALLGFGWLGAFLGKAPLVKSSLRVLVGGWMAMGITFGVTKLIAKTGV